MTSPVAHYKLKILLKSWLISQTEKDTGYVYWQGLDSLAAPFLILNFNDIGFCFKNIDNEILKLTKNLKILHIIFVFFVNFNVLYNLFFVLV